MPQFLRPISDKQIAGTWVTQAGSTVNLWTAIDEVIEDSTDYVESPSNPDSTMFYDVNLSPAETPINGSHILRYRIGKNATAGRSIVWNISLRRTSDNFIIASWSHSNVDAATTFQQTLTASQISNFNYGSGTYIHFDGSTSGGGAGRSARVFWAELEIPDPPPPTAATNVQSTNVTLNTASINWTPGSNLTRQELWRNTTGTWVKITDIAANTNTYSYTTNRTSPSGTSDSLRIDSVGTNGTTLQTAFSISWPTLGTPTVTATNIQEASLTLNWGAVPYADNYQVLRDGVSLGFTTSLTFPITGLTKLTSYTFTITAIFNEDTKTTSGNLTVKTGGAIPISIKIGTSWNQSEKMMILVGGQWKQVSGLKILIGGTWKAVF